MTLNSGVAAILRYSDVLIPQCVKESYPELDSKHLNFAINELLQVVFGAVCPVSLMSQRERTVKLTLKIY